MLRTRVVTAVFLLVGFVVLLNVLDSSGFAVAMLLISSIAAWEWGALCFKKNRVKTSFFTFLSVVAMTLVWMQFPSGGMMMSIIGSALWVVIVCMFVAGQIIRVSLSIQVVLGLLFIPSCYASLLLLRNGVGILDGQFLVWTLFLIVWSADIGAYFSGKKFGKTKLAADVSPNKTWEGLWGGVFSTALISVIFGYFGFEQFSVALMFWLGICIFSGLISVVGDLFESYIKRHANAKDSGSILPGHGGMLDRVDGVLAAAPIFTLLIISIYSA